MATIHIDGKEYDVDGADNLLQACLSIGLDIPYFCWHPALGSVGACRQCAVKQFQNAEDTRGRLVMSCMTAATDGTFISINDDEAKSFRKSVVEWLMTNHPHDCPVCEEGGNCHLQDVTVMTGHTFRRYRFTKRTHHNQDLGPFISHEMNRCIVCYRCVRYYKDYADGTDLGVYGAHDNIYFGRLENGMLENEFSGNLVEVCPTGVFTDKTHSERYNRKWDMQFAPSICQQCSIGCNISPGERYGELRRIENRYNGTINHYFLCDRGRFGYGYINLKDRPRQPMQRRGDHWITLSAEQAIQEAADMLRRARKVIGIGSPRASVESNFALRDLVGEDNFSTGIPASEQICLELMLKVLRDSGVHTPTLREIESYDAILILGEDLTQTSARLALSVRQAVKGKARKMANSQKVADWQIAAIFNIGQSAKYPLFLTSIDETRLDDIATLSYRAPIEDQARLGFAIAHEIDANAPFVNDIDKSLSRKIKVIVEALIGAKKPLIISGTHSRSESIIQAAANVATALKRRNINVGITLLADAANSVGLSMIGGYSLDAVLADLTNGVVDVLIVMENDLYRHLPKATVDKALSNTPNVIVLDHQRTATIEKAGLVLSAASFAESDGTVVSQEGRAQRFFQVYDPAYYDEKVQMLESWRWLHALGSTVDRRKVDWTQLDHIIDACVATFPQLAGIKQAAPDANFRIYGEKLARSPHRSSGRTAMRANISVHEPRQPQDRDTMFSFSMEGNNHPGAVCSQIPFAWAPGWNSPQAWNKLQAEIGGSLRNGDPGVRLIEAGTPRISWFENVPTTFIGNKYSWHVVPYFHLFGSEELTQRAPAIQLCMPEAYIMMNPEDAAKIGVNIGTMLEFNCQGEILCLPVRMSDNLRIGQVGLPFGLPGIPSFLIGSDIKNLKEAIK